jgi:hypothetical protein
MYDLIKAVLTPFLPLSIIEIIDSYQYKFNNIRTAIFSNIQQVVELPINKIATVTIDNKIIVYDTNLNIILYTIEAINNVINLNVTVIDTTKMIVGYIFNNGCNYSEIMDSSTGTLLRVIPNICINEIIISPDKLLVLIYTYSHQKEINILPLVFPTRGSIFGTNTNFCCVYNTNKFILACNNKINFYNINFLIPHFEYCHPGCTEALFPIILSDDTLVYYAAGVNQIVWFDIENKKVLDTINSGIKNIIQIYLLKEDKAIIILNYTRFSNEMWLWDLKSREKILKYPSLYEGQLPIKVVGILLEEKIVSLWGHNMVISNIRGNHDFIIPGVTKATVLEEGKIIAISDKDVAYTMK